MDRKKRGCLVEYCTPQHWFEHMFEWEDAAFGTEETVTLRVMPTLGSEQEACSDPAVYETEIISKLYLKDKKIKVLSNRDKWLVFLPKNPFIKKY